VHAHSVVAGPGEGGDGEAGGGLAAGLGDEHLWMCVGAKDKLNHLVHFLREVTRLHAPCKAMVFVSTCWCDLFWPFGVSLRFGGDLFWPFGVCLNLLVRSVLPLVHFGAFARCKMC